MKKFLLLGVLFTEIFSVNSQTSWQSNGANIFYSFGNVGIGTTNPSYKLDVGGTVSINGFGDIGNALSIFNSSKTQAGEAREWKIYNMTGIYGNSLQFWAYDYAQNSASGCLNLMDNGNVGIGTSTPSNKLDVNGTIRATEVKVESGWADFVFNEDYNLRPLSEVNNFIQANKHLPEIPSASEVKNEGVNLGEMQTKLLQKVEELTLYLIQQDNTIQELRSKIDNLENQKQ